MPSEPSGRPATPTSVRDLHDRLQILRRDISSSIALLSQRDSLAAVRLQGALDLLDAVLADLEHDGMPA
jgi:hypothetical protein